jgi:hypothetical protein
LRTAEFAKFGAASWWKSILREVKRTQILLQT